MSNFILQCAFLYVIKRLRLVYLIGTGTTLTGYSGWLIFDKNITRKNVEHWGGEAWRCIGLHVISDIIIFKTAMLLKWITRDDNPDKQTSKKHRQMQLKLGGFAPMLISEFKICFLKTVTLFSIPPIYPHFPSLTYSLFPFFPLLLLPPLLPGNMWLWSIPNV